MTTNRPISGAKLVAEGVALALAKATGKPLPDVSPEARRIFDDVQANNARLDDCAGPHAFERGSGPVFGAKYTCGHCGGTVDGVWFSAYLKGLEHGRKSPT